MTVTSITESREARLEEGGAQSYTAGIDSIGLFEVSGISPCYATASRPYTCVDDVDIKCRVIRFANEMRTSVADLLIVSVPLDRFFFGFKDGQGNGVSLITPGDVRPFCIDRP